MKTALITGVTGQDGSWLAKLLLEKGYRVFGGVHSVENPPYPNLEHLKIQDRIEFIPMDLSLPDSVGKIIEELCPGELYNLAAMSFVGDARNDPALVARINGMAVVEMLESIRLHSPKTRFFQASSAELFGDPAEVPQTESTPFCPASLYGVTKLFAHQMTEKYRDEFGLHTSCGILYNHESELRGKQFVTRKITSTVARQARGSTKILELGNLEARRDWGYAPEYVDAMHRMLQKETGDTFILATGRATTVRDFVETAYRCAGMEIRWDGDVGIEATGSGRKLVCSVEKFYRPSSSKATIGSPEKAKRILSWEPSTDLMGIARRMIRFDLSI